MPSKARIRAQIDRHLDVAKSTTITWKKSCACVGATASTNQMQTVQRGHKVVIKFHPGPSCDRCGEAWRQTKKLTPKGTP